MKIYRNKISAFSLVELSIVLVILGLLTGGILAGQSLIHAAEQRQRMAFTQEFTIAWGSFRDKYFQLPGDMPNATAFWGRSTLTGDLCLTDSGTPSPTGACNGNGSGKIEWNVAQENYQVWYHLKLAGMFNSRPHAQHFSYNTTAYNIAPGSGNGWAHVGSNQPQADLYAHPSNAAFGSNAVGNSLQFARYNTAMSAPLSSYLTPEDTWNLDTKFDDGRLQSGSFRAQNGYVFGGVGPLDPCAIGTNPDYEYNLAYKGVACRFSVLLP